MATFDGMAGIEVTGSAEASIKATINFKGQGNKIVTDGSYKMGSLIVSYSIRAVVSVLGNEATWELAEGKKEISKDGAEEKIEETVLHDW